MIHRIVLLLTITTALLAQSCSRSNSVPTAKQIELIQLQTDQRIASAPAPIASTIELSLSVTDGAGQRFLTGDRVVSVRSDGSTATVVHRFTINLQVVNSIRHLEFADGKVVEVDDVAKTYTSLQLPQGQRALLIQRLDPRSQCDSELGGRKPEISKTTKKQLLGYNVVEFSAKNADHQSIYWRAPELNCATLQASTIFLNPRGGVEAHEEELARIVERGEPRLDTFMIPADYVPVSFSGMTKKDAAFGKSVTSLSLDEEDALYERYKH